MINTDLTDRIMCIYKRGEHRRKPTDLYVVVLVERNAIKPKILYRVVLVSGIY